MSEHHDGILGRVVEGFGFLPGVVLLTTREAWLIPGDNQIYEEKPEPEFCRGQEPYRISEKASTLVRSETLILKIDDWAGHGGISITLPSGTQILSLEEIKDILLVHFAAKDKG